MSRIYVPNEPMRYEEGHLVPILDLRPAREYGQLVFLTGARAPLDPCVLRDELWQQLQDFDPANDYFMPVGNPTVGAMAAAIIGIVTQGEFNILEYDREQRAYTVVRLQAVAA